MMNKKTIAIFTGIELYNYCLAEVCAMGIIDETGYHSDWSEFVSSDYEEKINELSLYQQDYFDDKLKKVAKKLRNDFENLPDNIQTEEDLSYLIEFKDELICKVMYNLEEFLIEDN